MTLLSRPLIVSRMTDGATPTSTRHPGPEPALPEGVERDSRGGLFTYLSDGQRLTVAAEDGRLAFSLGDETRLTYDEAIRVIGMMDHVRTYGSYDEQAKERRVVRP